MSVPNAALDMLLICSDLNAVEYMIYPGKKTLSHVLDVMS